MRGPISPAGLPTKSGASNSLIMVSISKDFPLLSPLQSLNSPANHPDCSGKRSEIEEKIWTNLGMTETILSAALGPGRTSVQMMNLIRSRPVIGWNCQRWALIGQCYLYGGAGHDPDPRPDPRHRPVDLSPWVRGNKHITCNNNHDDFTDSQILTRTVLISSIVILGTKSLMFLTSDLSSDCELCEMCEQSELYQRWFWMRSWCCSAQLSSYSLLQPTQELKNCPSLRIGCMHKCFYFKNILLNYSTL